MAEEYLRDFSDLPIPWWRRPGGTRSFARDLTHNDDFIDCDPAALAVLEEDLPEMAHDFRVDVS
jgi:hypothetical protein